MTRHAAYAASPSAVASKRMRPKGCLRIAWSAPRVSVVDPPAPRAARRASVPMTRYTSPFAANPTRTRRTIQGESFAVSAATDGARGEGEWSSAAVDPEVVAAAFDTVEIPRARLRRLALRLHRRRRL